MTTQTTKAPAVEPSPGDLAIKALRTIVDNYSGGSMTAINDSIMEAAELLAHLEK